LRRRRDLDFGKVEAAQSDRTANTLDSAENGIFSGSGLSYYVLLNGIEGRVEEIGGILSCADD
jgi:hypothetical protein